MKKFLVGILLLIACFCVAPTTIFSQAEENDNIEFSTLYPENVLYYQDLNNIDNIAVNSNYIAYNLSNTKLNILNQSTRQLTTIDTFTKLIDFKFVSQNQLIIVDYNGTDGNVYFATINTDGSVTTKTINEITLSNLQLVDINVNNNKALIGIIKSSTTTNNSFELFEIEIISQQPSTPIKKDSYTSEQLNNARHLVINETQMFVVFNNTDSQPRLLSKTYGSNTFTTTDTIANIQTLDFYNYNGLEYLVTFTLENLSLLPLDQLDVPETYLTGMNITDIDIFADKIYIAEATNKSIESYTITTEGTPANTLLKQEAILVSAKNNAVGRFNSVNDIYVQGNTLYVSDTKNNRIQIIEDQTVTVIDGLLVDSQPQSVTLDTNKNIYFVKKTSASTSSISKYSMNAQNKYEYSEDYSTYNLLPLGLVSDATISTNDELFILDYTNNKLLMLNHETGLQSKYNFAFTLTAFSKIEYIKGSNLLAILNNNTIYLLDPIKLDSPNSPIIDSLAVTNCADITSGLDTIITLSDNTIKNITISDGVMQTSQNSLVNTRFSQLITITYNITNSQIIGFDNNTQSIIYFNYLLDNNLDFEDIDNTTNLTTSPLAIEIINNANIYELPYNIGNQYSGLDNCIGIELYNNTYYRVLFKNNGILKIGFLHKDNADIKSVSIVPKINVITTNLKVPVYKYPTILKYNSHALITSYIPINTSINISSTCFPVTIDGKSFYTYESNGTVGYIFNADVILNNNSNITTLHNNNATIKAIGEDEIHIYDEDKTTILATIYNDDRVSVDNYDKHSEYTLVYFKTANLTTITGYIKTDYIEMDEIDDNKIVLIILIVLSIIILIGIIISYIVIKKRKN